MGDCAASENATLLALPALPCRKMIWSGFTALHRIKSGPLELWYDSHSKRRTRRTDKRTGVAGLSMHGHPATLARTTPCPCSGPADRARRRSTAASFCAVVADTYAVVGPGIVLPDHPPCDERPDCLLRNGAGQFAANQSLGRSKHNAAWSDCLLPVAARARADRVRGFSRPGPCSLHRTQHRG